MSENDKRQQQEHIATEIRDQIELLNVLFDQAGALDLEVVLDTYDLTTDRVSVMRLECKVKAVL